ncbi:MAG: toll/interleukin-1 receptor domain-containing protein [Bacteroidales bacterium]|jgi:hypothetical protein|nr:toll/interleukin-1 receptor domain-containing protein [Bacteroidales bacterium]
MAKIYISYNNQDKDIAHRISDILKSESHEILIDTDILRPGQDITSTLIDALRKSDFMVVIITENSMNSKWVQNEIGAALSYSNERPNFGLLPVVIGNPEIPESIQHKMYIKGDANDVDGIALTILQSINQFLGRREALKAKGEENKKNTDDYINHELEKLENKQKVAKRIYYVWNVVGFLTLVVSAGFLLSKFSAVGSDLTSMQAIIITIKSVLVISFLIACSRYSFLMGKIALDEAITLGERIHAISFGKVFIQMFSDDFTKDEMYKVFENWNTTPAKGTESYRAEDYDPNLIKIITELVKVIKK